MLMCNVRSAAIPHIHFTDLFLSLLLAIWDVSDTSSRTTVSETLSFCRSGNRKRWNLFCVVEWLFSMVSGGFVMQGAFLLFLKATVSTHSGECNCTYGMFSVCTPTCVQVWMF